MAKAGKKTGTKAQPASQKAGSPAVTVKVQKPATRGGRRKSSAAAGEPGVLEVVTVETVAIPPKPAASLSPSTAEVKELHAQLKAALTEVHTLRKQLGSAREEASAEMTRFKAELASAAAAVGELRQTCADLSASVVAEVREQSPASSGMRHLRGQLDELNHSATTAQAGVGALGGECTKALEAFDALNAFAGKNGPAFQKALAEALDGLRGLKTEIAELRTRAAAVPQPAAAETAPAAEPPAHTNRFGAEVAPGVVVADVVADSPAAEAGLMRGDVLEEANGAALTSGGQLRDAVQAVATGENVVLQLRRGGERQMRTVRLGDETADEGHGSRFGVTVAPGVVVAAVFAGSPAEAAGLAGGDVIEEAHGRPVASGEELFSVVHSQPEGADVALVVTRAGERRELVVHLDQA